MKKAIWIVALAVLVPGLILHGQSITVTSPAAGSEWPIGSTRTISWTSSGVSGSVDVILRRAEDPSAPPVLGIAAGTANDGTESWAIPANIAPGDYLARIRSLSSPGVYGDSANFKIIANLSPGSPPGPRLKMESPNGGESWRLGSDHVISWTGKFMTGKVQLQLYRHPCCGVGVIAEDLPATGTFTWQAGKYLGNTAPAGQYNIRVLSMTDHTVFDVSDQPFTLALSMADVPGPGHAKILKTVSLPGVYLTFPSSICFPSYAQAYFPQSAYQAAMAAFNTAACHAAGANTTAIAGIHWVTMSDPRFKIAAVYRSRIHFNLNPYAGQGGQLASAKLKLKRIHAIDQDANCSAACACSEVVAVLKAVMTSFDIPGSIGQNFPLPLGQAEFALDVTDIVRQWLDGTLANHGLVLMTNELPCSNCDRLCVSCYEASLVLKLD